MKATTETLLERARTLGSTQLTGSTARHVRDALALLGLYVLLFSFGVALDLFNRFAETAREHPGL
ncbi:MAG: hypothetical protein ACXW3D_09645, partial [Caulobacteraceae bacterium]